MEIFKDFFACRIVLAADHRYPENIQTPFHLQICLNRKSSITRKYSKIFSPAELSLPQIIDAPKIFKHFFTCRYVLVANHQQLGKIQKLFRLQNSLRRRPSTTGIQTKNFSPAKLSWRQIITIPKTFKDFFACRIVLAADHRYPESIQRLFQLQNCLSRKSSTTWKYSNLLHMQNSLSRKASTTWKQSTTFSPAEISQSQIINNMEIFKDFFACRIVLAADHRYPENIQTPFHLQICLSRKSSITRKYSKIFSPAELSLPQIIDAPKIFKHFVTCRYVLAADHRYPESIRRLFQLQNCLSRKSSTTWKYSNLLHMQNSLSGKASTTWKQSTTFSPAEISQSQIINNMEIFRDFFACRIVLAADHRYPEIIQTPFHLQICLSRKSSLTRKYSKVFSPAELSLPQIIDAPKFFNQFFTWRYVLVANHQKLGKIQRLFRLQNSLRRRSLTTWINSKIFSPAKLSWPQIINTPKIFKDFFTCRSVLAKNHQQHGNNHRLFRLQICLGRRSSIPRKLSKTFSPAEFSQTQIINNLEIFKDSFACKTVLAADHRYPENIQRLSHLQICLSRKSSTTWKNSKTFSPAEFSQMQTINNLEIFNDFLACKTVLAANHHYPESIQRLFQLQNCLSRKSSTTWKYSNLFHMQNSLGRKSSTTWKQSTTFSPADISQSQIINNMEIF